MNFEKIFKNVYMCVPFMGRQIISCFLTKIFSMYNYFYINDIYIDIKSYLVFF